MYCVLSCLSYSVFVALVWTVEFEAGGFQAVGALGADPATTAKNSAAQEPGVSRHRPTSHSASKTAVLIDPP